MDTLIDFEAAYQTASNDRVRLLKEVERLTGVLREARSQVAEAYERTGFPSLSELYLFLNAALDVDEEGQSLPPPTEAHARRSDPGTSHLAAMSINDIPDRYYAVWFVLDVNGPSTDEELIEKFEGIRTQYRLEAGPQSVSSIRTRRNEATKGGIVRWTGGHRKTKSGRKARVWEAIPRR